MHHCDFVLMPKTHKYLKIRCTIFIQTLNWLTQKMFNNYHFPPTLSKSLFFFSRKKGIFSRSSFPPYHKCYVYYFRKNILPSKGLSFYPSIPFYPFSKVLSLFLQILWWAKLLKMTSGMGRNFQRSEAVPKSEFYLNYTY